PLESRAQRPRERRGVPLECESHSARTLQQSPRHPPPYSERSPRVVTARTTTGSRSALVVSTRIAVNALAHCIFVANAGSMYCVNPATAEQKPSIMRKAAIAADD